MTKLTIWRLLAIFFVIVYYFLVSDLFSSASFTPAPHDNYQYLSEAVMNVLNLNT